MLGSSAFVGLLALLRLRTCLAQTTVTVSDTATHDIPSSLWGQMYEDINSGDGGLYAELLRNRAFQKVDLNNQTVALEGWSALGADLSVVADDQPLSSALPNSLSVSIPEDASGDVGFTNGGYWGIKVDSSWTYKVSFNYRFPTASEFAGSVSVNLQSVTGDILASESVDLSGSSTDWTSVNLTLTPTETPDNFNNLFAIVFNGEEAAGQTIHFSLLSLFPPTFKDRENGMRIDIAEALLGATPAFFRFPGGNNLEGEVVETRWKWWETVGPLSERPGRQGDWRYINTDGLGLLEYLYWCEDMEMEPIMGVYAGYSLTGDVVPEDELGPYVQEAIDQIHFVISDAASNEQAALRASLGREEPFALRYVEIGNEDWINTAPETYEYRWKAYASAIQAEFPDLKLIATTHPFDPILDPVPEHYDIHVYEKPSWFWENSFFYDDFERNGTTYFEGEYAVINDEGQVNEPRYPFPTLLGAVAEAAFMIGMERNSDIVFAAGYAPLLNHVNGSQWTPNLVGFDAANVFLSTSYYVQKLFSEYSGDEFLEATVPERGGTVYWSVVRTGGSTITIKVVNVAEEAAEVAFELPWETISSPANAIVLTGAPEVFNSPEEPSAVAPVESEVEVSSAFTYEAPAHSFSVITFEVS